MDPPASPHPRPDNAPCLPPFIPKGLDPLAIGRSAFVSDKPPAETPQPPEVEGFDKFTLLAAGGFGVVWKARQRGHNRCVALKIPHTSTPLTDERLEQEAEALRALDHPHIVRLLDLTYSSQGLPVLVMELVEGPTLAESLPPDGYDFARTLHLFLPVLEAVAHAHLRGITHRDLKPGNIILTPHGAPKVTDFDLARPLPQQSLAFSLTKSGLIAGTVEYLAPERYNPDHPVGPAADIYALGIILYEMLSGTPPRGSWPLLSQIKNLDIRLDDLIAEAIHPDPASRLRSVEQFRQRLVEIQNSRPRYAGTPKLTRSIRAMDLAWTVGGLYFLAAGFASLLKINNTKVPAFLDLTFGHSRHLGGYWALWVLTAGMGLLWAWQFFRLRRFRHIPLREALPSPFGLRLGTTTGAAVLVAASQLSCAWAPLFFMGWIHSQSWVWAAPDTAPWEKVLAITRWGSEVPISPWTWDPSGFLSADEFWIREMQPGLTPGTWILIDRQSFFVVTQPLIQLLSAGAILSGILATLAAAARDWRHPRTKTFLPCLAVFLGCAGSFQAANALARTERDALRLDSAGRDGRTMEQALLRKALPLAQSILQSLTETSHCPSSSPSTNTTSTTTHGPEAPTRHLIQQAYGPEILTEGNVRMTHGQFQQWLPVHFPGRAAARADYGNIVCGLHAPRSTGPGHFAVRHWMECYTAEPGGSVRGSYWRILMEGRTPALHAARTGPAPLFTGWFQQEELLYTGPDKDLPVAEAAPWLEEFLTCLAAPECPGLEHWFLPRVLPVAPNRSLEAAVPMARDAALAVIRDSRRSWSELTFSPEPGTLAVLRLSGGRQQLSARVHQSGIRHTDGPAATTLHWRLELVFSDNAWRILRLQW